MSYLTQKFNEEEMMKLLGELLYADESIKAAVYCVYKDTGFFASSRHIITGYAAITDKGRFIGYKMDLVSTAAVSFDMQYLTKIKISNVILGQKMVHMEFNNGKKEEVKFQLVPKVGGGKFPDQERYFEIMLDELTARQNLLA